MGGINELKSTSQIVKDILENDDKAEAHRTLNEEIFRKFAKEEI